MTAATTRVGRQARIVTILSSKSVRSQSELAAMLADEGIEVTQATLSRDLEELGYQVQSAWFVERSMEAWATMVAALASVREGDGTLLDNCLVMAHSDCSFAKTHSSARRCFSAKPRRPELGGTAMSSLAARHGASLPFRTKS